MEEYHVRIYTCTDDTKPADGQWDGMVMGSNQAEAAINAHVETLKAHNFLQPIVKVRLGFCYPTRYNKQKRFA